TGSDPDPGDGLEATLDWGDGTAPVGGPLPFAAAPTHTYSTSGTFVVRLAVSDGAVSDVVTDVVRVGSAEPLTAAAGDDQVIASGAVVKLDGSASRPSVGIGSYHWVVRDAAGAVVTTRTGSLVEWLPLAPG